MHFFLILIKNTVLACARQTQPADCVLYLAEVPLYLVLSISKFTALTAFRLIVPVVGGWFVDGGVVDICLWTILAI